MFGWKNLKKQPTIKRQQQCDEKKLKDIIYTVIKQLKEDEKKTKRKKRDHDIVSLVRTLLLHSSSGRNITFKEEENDSDSAEK